MAGLGVALVAFLFVGISGLADYEAGAAILVFLQYAAQLIAGYVAGRLAPHARVAHGGIGGMLSAAIAAAIAAAAAGSGTNLGFLVFALVVATVSGSAGGALAELRRSGTGLP